MSNLGELGLSSYEEKVYRALLTLGSAPAGDVSDASGVPMGRIYDVLNGLEARDVVRAQSTDPTTYAAVEPEVAVDRLLAERQRELDARAERYEAVAAEVGPELAAIMPTESRFWTAPLGSEAAVTLVGEVFDAADGTVRSAMSRPYECAPWERYEPEVDPFLDVLDDDLTVELLLSASMLRRVPPAVRAEYRDAPAPLEIRVTTDLTITFDLVDAAAVSFHVPHPLDDGERLGVIDVRDAELAGRLDRLFDEAWAEAAPLEAVIEDATESRVDGSADGDDSLAIGE